MLLKTVVEASTPLKN